MSSYNTLVTILKRSEGRDQFCGMGAAACELVAWNIAHSNITPLNVPALLGWSAEKSSNVEAAFTKASKSFGSNRRWLRFALCIYEIASIRRLLAKFNPSTASIEDWRSQIGQVAGFFSCLGDDISVLGDLGVLPKPLGKFGGQWCCRLWFFCALLGTWKNIAEWIRSVKRLRQLRSRQAASSPGRSILQGSVVSDYESLQESKALVCRNSVSLVTSACDIVWSSSCAFENAGYNPAFVAACALFTQAVGFKRYWTNLRAQLAADQAAAAATATTNGHK